MVISHPKSNMAMLNGTQMIVAVQKGPSELCGCDRTLITPALCYDIPKDLVLLSLFSQNSSDWKEPLEII